MFLVLIHIGNINIYIYKLLEYNQYYVNIVYTKLKIGFKKLENIKSHNNV